ncbi:MAG TPA: urate oxidase [Vicinamibacterales bacterium]
MIAWSRYGKSRVRMVRLDRSAEPHGLGDLTIDVQLEGAFEPVYDGDNRLCVATDTMKNTVYALARQAPIDHIETFASTLAGHFAGKPAVTAARITVAEQPWTHIEGANGRSHPHAFRRPGGEQWIAVVTRNSRGTTITSGLRDLLVMKSSGSAFSRFPRDEYTTLPETEDRILATSITADWTYRAGMSDFTVRSRIRQALLDAFAAHQSRSVQHTLAEMGQPALMACTDIDEITIRLPNRHHLLVDLAPFGLDNPNQIFVPTEEPYGLIEGTIRR